MVTINIEKKGVFIILASLILLSGIIITFAYTTSTPNPGHGADSVLISISGDEMTLQQAIDSGKFSSSSSTISEPTCKYYTSLVNGNKEIDIPDFCYAEYSELGGCIIYTKSTVSTWEGDRGPFFYSQTSNNTWTTYEYSGTNGDSTSSEIMDYTNVYGASDKLYLYDDYGSESDSGKWSLYTKGTIDLEERATLIVCPIEA